MFDMKEYVVNNNSDNNPNNDHEVHTTDCPQYSYMELGHHFSCDLAIEAAKEFYDNIDGCVHCCFMCHTS